MLKNNMTDAKIITKKEKSLNRHWKNFVDKDYLGSHNLEKGEEMMLTIEKFVGEEKIKTADGEKVKQVLYFKEEVPKMIMNITNGNILSALYGSHPDAWIGKKIQLYAANVKAFGKEQEALRIRDFVPERSIDATAYIAEMKKATTQKELKDIWVKFPASARNDAELIKSKDVIKTALPE